MSLRGVENFRPNPDGTYGPNHWTWKQVEEWARADIARTNIASGLMSFLAMIFFGFMFAAALSGHR